MEEVGRLNSVQLKQIDPHILKHQMPYKKRDDYNRYVITVPVSLFVLRSHTLRTLSLPVLYSVLVCTLKPNDVTKLI